MSMEIDFFAETSYGKVALQKMAPTDPDFRLYYAGWMGEPNDRQVMKVMGAVFRPAKRGRFKGQLHIKVVDTERTAYVTAEEMVAAETSQEPANLFGVAA